MEWPFQAYLRLYLYSCQPESPSLSQDSRDAWNTGNFPFSTLGHWEGKDNFGIFFNIFFLFQENRFCGSCHRIIQLLLKTNILNIQNADFSYISTVKQYSTLKDYYYFCKRWSVIFAYLICILRYQDTTSAVGTSHVSAWLNVWYWTASIPAIFGKKLFWIILTLHKIGWKNH